MAKAKRITGIGIMGPSKADMQRYQATDDVRTLQSAEEIKADKGRHARARAHAVKEASRLTKIAKPKR